MPHVVQLGLESRKKITDRLFIITVIYIPFGIIYFGIIFAMLLKLRIFKFESCEEPILYLSFSSVNEGTKLSI